MTLGMAIFYGVLQGLTEFLPISSSAHLAVLPHILKIEDPGLTFDLMLHFGTVLAVIIYFRHQLMIYLRLIPHFIPRKNAHHQHILTAKEHQHFFVLKNLVISTVVSFLFIIILKNVAFQYGRQLSSIAFFMFFFGLLMWVSDWYAKRFDGEQFFFPLKCDWIRSSIMGLAQALAIFPGVSRSGATLTAARLMKISREEAAEFSFLMSIPVILAGTASKMMEYISYRFVHHEPAMVQIDWFLCFVGVITSLLVGLLVIHYFLRFIKKMGLFYFSIYRFLFTLLIYLTFLR
jgi:undecaprenyl-diphosphatase